MFLNWMMTGIGNALTVNLTIPAILEAIFISVVDADEVIRMLFVTADHSVALNRITTGRDMLDPYTHLTSQTTEALTVPQVASAWG
jgi:hypothetical protein